MTAVKSPSASQTTSQIDIQLWAREQRRRWFMRNLLVPFQVLVRSTLQAAARAMTRFTEPAAARSA